MGLTRQYLRYEPAALFGLVASARGNAVFVALRGERGRYVAVPACEHVFVWDTRKGEKVRPGPCRGGLRGAEGGVCACGGRFRTAWSKAVCGSGSRFKGLVAAQLPPFSVVWAQPGVCLWCDSAALGAPWLNLTAHPVRFTFGSIAGEEQLLPQRLQSCSLFTWRPQ